VRRPAWAERDVRGDIVEYVCVKVAYGRTDNTKFTESYSPLQSLSLRISKTNWCGEKYVQLARESFNIKFGGSVVSMLYHAELALSRDVITPLVVYARYYTYAGYKIFIYI